VGAHFEPPVLAALPVIFERGVNVTAQKLLGIEVGEIVDACLNVS
jgi:hypothetical protein